jgi:hypothetical protein
MQRPKFTIQKKVMDFTSKIERVINETACGKHGAPEGYACFVVADNRSVCNKRASMIYTGTITHASHKRPHKKEHKA